MAAQLSDPELGLEIWLGCDVMAWGTPKITVPTGKINKIFDSILVRATRPWTLPPIMLCWPTVPLELLLSPLRLAAVCLPPLIVARSAVFASLGLWRTWLHPC